MSEHNVMPVPMTEEQNKRRSLFRGAWQIGGDNRSV